MQYLRDNAGVLESSSDGADWLAVQLGNADTLNSPIALGSLLIRDNTGDATLEVSNNGGTTWRPLYQVGLTKLNNSYFVPPFVTQATEPIITEACLENTGSLVIWHNTVDNKTYLMVNDNGTIKKVELT